MKLSKYVSLFAGIGGIDLALHWHGLEPTLLCEYADFPQSILRRHWPGVPVVKDVREVTAAQCDAAHVIAGGFPCQPFSTAGKRGGQEDERYLWPECVRLMREVRPLLCIWENVDGLRTMREFADDPNSAGHLLAQILRDATAAGYSVEWEMVPAYAAGAPHVRERLFLVCARDDVGPLWQDRARPAAWPTQGLVGPMPHKWPRAGAALPDGTVWTRRPLCPKPKIDPSRVARNRLGIRPEPPVVWLTPTTMDSRTLTEGDVEHAARFAQGEFPPDDEYQHNHLYMDAAAAELRDHPPEEATVYPTPCASDGGMAGKGSDLGEWQKHAARHAAKGVNKQLPLSVVARVADGDEGTGETYRRPPPPGRIPASDRTVFPTPTATLSPSAAGRGGGANLSRVALEGEGLMDPGSNAVWPTPLAGDGQRRRSSDNWDGNDLVSTVTDVEEAGGRPQPASGAMLNARWVEWLMYFPQGWTDPEGPSLVNERPLPFHPEPDMPRVGPATKVAKKGIKGLGNAVCPASLDLLLDAIDEAIAGRPDYVVPPVARPRPRPPAPPRRASPPPPPPRPARRAPPPPPKR